MWRFEASLVEVWNALYDVYNWPLWWRGLENVVEIESNDGDIGSVAMFTWKGVLPYRLRFSVKTTSIVSLSMMSGTATGDLNGTGVWRFNVDQNTTVVWYDWKVRTAGWWMDALDPVARPFITWNHDMIMKWGGAGLARFLGTRLLELDKRAG